MQKPKILAGAQGFIRGTNYKHPETAKTMKYIASQKTKNGASAGKSIVTLPTKTVQEPAFP